MEIIINFYKDLEKYTQNDIDLMAKTIDLPNINTRGKRWLLAVHYSKFKAHLPSFLENGPINIETVLKYHQENPSDIEFQNALPKIISIMEIPNYNELKKALTYKTDFMKKLLKVLLQDESYQIKLIQKALTTNDLYMLYDLYEFPITKNATTIGLGIALGSKNYDIFRFLLQYDYKFDFIEKKIQKLMDSKFYDIFYSKMKPEQIENKYIFKKILGKGSYGTVWLAVDKKTNKEVAIKILVPRDFIDISRIQDEIEILQKISNICQRYSTCILDKYWVNGRPRIVMDYIKGQIINNPYYPRSPEKKVYIGTLLDYIKYRSIDDRNTNISIMTHLIQGMDLFHKLGIANNDIKEANILWDGISKVPKYTDWGLSCLTRKYCNETKCTGGVNCDGTVGTPYTRQPMNNNSKQSLMAGDMWSLGIVLLDFYLTPTGGDPVEDIHKPDFYFRYGGKLIGTRPQGEIDMYIERIKNKFGKDIIKLLLRKSRTERLANWNLVMSKIEKN